MMQSYDIEPYRKLGYFAESGITSGHFKVFRDVAAETGTIILVRKGNRTCLRWIEQGYPAKPMTVYLSKTSPRTGKVTCDGTAALKTDQVRQVHQAGHYVLEPHPRSKCLRALNPLSIQPEIAKEFPLDSTEMNEPGQVIEADSGLAMTGDYDLMGVIDVRALGRSTSGKRRGSGASFDRTNPLATAVIAKLNGRFGRRRITHGPHDLRYRVDEHNEAGCTVFYPDDGVYFLPTVSDLKEFYDKGLHNNPHPTRPRAAATRAR